MSNHQNQFYKVKILYDHQAFTYQKWGGVSKSFCELIANRPAGMDYEIAVVESENHHLLSSNLVKGVNKISRDLVSFHNLHSFWGREKIYTFLGESGILHTAEATNKKNSINKLIQGDYDVFHPTFFDNYFFPYLNGKPFVLTVHDLMPELFGWYKGDPQIANKPELCEKAAAIVAVSENTKKDLCRMYNIPENKVHVVYHGCPEPDNTNNTGRLISEPYFLYVGRRDGYKNWRQTVVDFSVFNRTHPEVKLVCTGTNFSTDEKKFLHELQVANSVEHFFATDSQLANLYSYAIAFIFPSLYEGFGMPILESFAFECPTLLNDKSCFPEIGGNAALFFDSQDGESNLAELMEEVYSMTDDEIKELNKKGKKRLEVFSWKESSRKLFNIYNNI